MPPTDKMVSPDCRDWDRFWGEESSRAFTQSSWSKRRMIALMRPWVAAGKSALDAGCGSGFFAKHFCDEGMRATALDYSDGALRIAAQQTGGRATILKKDLVNEDLSQSCPEKFDLIFSDGLLEHFPGEEQDKIVRNLIRVLTPDGQLITFVPNRWSPWELIRPFFMPGIEETPFIMSELLDLNRRNGLRVTTQGGLNTFPFALSPDVMLGSSFGMLLYTVAQKNV